jgi:Carboxypeptidase regulatory-like domain
MRTCRFNTTAAALATVLIFGLSMPRLQSQSANGTITGIVMDVSQGAIVSAKIMAINRGTGIRTEAASSGAGVYTLSLPPSHYDISIEARGFKTSVHQDVEVNLNQTTRLDVTLEVGATTERINVTSEAPLVQSDTSELGMVIHPKSLSDLPLSTPGQRRMADTFTLLAPGVNSGTGGGGGTPFLAWNMGGQWTTNGSQRNSKEVLYDGVSMGKQHSDGRLWAESPPPDSIQEFKMMTGSYSLRAQARMNCTGRLTISGVMTYCTRAGSSRL